MPRSSTKSLTFPVAGVSRRGAYRQQTSPFSAPWAMNVRTFGPSESRRRGGSRPGLEKLCPDNLGNVTSLIPIAYIDQDGDRQYDLVYVADGLLGLIRDGVNIVTTQELEDDTGEDITADDDVTMDFGVDVTATSLNGAVRNGAVLLADTTLLSYDPSTGVVEPVLASAGIVPTGEPLIAVYRDRVFLAGQSQAWFASRQCDPTDWDYGSDFEDPASAVAGQLSDAGMTGDVITAMIPIHDQRLVMATENTLWVISGDPMTGSLRNVSEVVGIIDPDAWAMDPDGLVVFLSNDGIYTYDGGTGRAPTRFSEERVPDELREIDPTTTTISMAYDSVERGFHLFLTPAAGNATHWWIDVESRAFWPQRFDEVHQPLDAAHLGESGLGRAVVASKDGFVRFFRDMRADDDGEVLESHVIIGPVRVSANDVLDGLLAEIHGVMENVSTEIDGKVTWRVFMGRSAAEAADAAVDDLKTYLEGNAPSNVAASGTWTEGRGRVQRPRTRGAWTAIWLSSKESWSYEIVAIVGRLLGRHR